jgi:hypothetical protein
MQNPHPLTIEQLTELIDKRNRQFAMRSQLTNNCMSGFNVGHEARKIDEAERIKRDITIRERLERED